MRGLLTLGLVVLATGLAQAGGDEGEGLPLDLRLPSGESPQQLEVQRAHAPSAEELAALRRVTDGAPLGQEQALIDLLAKTLSADPFALLSYVAANVYPDAETVYGPRLRVLSGSASPTLHQVAGEIAARIQLAAQGDDPALAALAENLWRARREIYAMQIKQEKASEMLPSGSVRPQLAASLEGLRRRDATRARNLIEEAFARYAQDREAEPQKGMRDLVPGR